MNYFERINRHQYLFLDKLTEHNDLELDLYISQAGSDAGNQKPLEKVSAYKEIKTGTTATRYKVRFKNYVAFSVRNESFTVWDDYEKFSGNLFRLYSKSRFLDYLPIAVELFIVENTQENEVRHYGLVCLNNIIDVATCYEPLIEEIFNF